MMTRKDFEGLARRLAMIRVEVEELPWLSAKNTLHLLVEAVADFCATSNPRFDRQRFIEATHMDFETIRSRFAAERRERSKRFDLHTDLVEGGTITMHPFEPQGCYVGVADHAIWVCAMSNLGDCLDETLVEACQAGSHEEMEALVAFANEVAPGGETFHVRDLPERP